MTATPPPWKPLRIKGTDQWDIRGPEGAFYWPINTTKENAFLASASPLLLSACKVALRWLQHGMDPTKLTRLQSKEQQLVIKHLRSAIKSAEAMP